MSFNINPGNFSGLAAMAGNVIGNLGLPTPHPASNGAGDLMKGLAGGLSQLQNHSLKEKKLEMAQQQLGNKDAATQERLRMSQERIDQRGSLADMKMEFEKKKLDVQQRLKSSETEAKKRMQMTKEDLHTRTTASAQFLNELKQAETPEQERMIIENNLNSAKESGIIDNDEYSKMWKAPTNEVSQILMSEIIMNDKILDRGLVKSKAPAERGKKEASTPTVQTDSDGASSIPFVKLETTTKKDVENEQIKTNDSLNQLDRLTSQYKKDYLGAGGQLKRKVLGIRDYASTSPILGSTVELDDDQKKWLHNYSDFSANAKSIALQVIKDASGLSYTDKQLEFMKQVVPDPEVDSPSIFEGKLDGMKNRLESIKGIKEGLIKQGVKLGTKEYEDKWITEAKTTMLSDQKGASEVDPKIQRTIEHYKNQGYSEDEVRSKLKEQGVIK